MVERKDVEAALEARRELGREYEPEIVEKIERRLREQLAIALINMAYAWRR
jgi:hypothetical protein